VLKSNPNEAFPSIYLERNKLEVEELPRKEMYQTPKYIAEAIREKRRNLLYGSYFCPKCKMNKLRIQVDKKEKEVFAFCPCGIKHQLIFVPVFEAVDYYNKFMDEWNRKQ